MRNEGVAEIAKQLGCSKAYVSMVMSGKKKPSKRMAAMLKKVNSPAHSEPEGVAFKSVDGHLKCPWWVRHPFAPARTKSQPRVHQSFPPTEVNSRLPSRPPEPNWQRSLRAV